ncbi:MAG: imidazolonepropionase [Melioribacteraceae bacterium]|nr:imidazolonepropionase [Melioribacteraceae bacterium]MCF8354394.1 imidazolonepropionase [Melioribacteraceae bacterium]MCF8393009.1 imidazolonepropionase [Melioribacteraceae bacterium]MCF8417248.1 imidazolonepropionase [Melioribacteraceae bacterium]
MLTLLKNPAQIVTCNTNKKNYKRGKELNDVGILTEHSLLLEDEKIKNVIANENLSQINYNNSIDCTGKIILPGLIDCHTHTAFAGSRADEFRQRLSGLDYEEIAKKGGGINATVKAVRNSSYEEILNVTRPRIDYFISQGVTSLEIKTGYGLSYYDEIKLLQVIQKLNSEYEIDIISTFLGAHTFPPEYKNDPLKYIKIIVEELIPFIAENKLAHFVDVFCESTAFSADQTEQIFLEAEKHGFKLKLHTEQFNNIGGLDVALKHKAVSVDHLEVISEDDIKKLSTSETVVVMLPGVSFFLDYGYAPARKIIDSGGIVALSTDYNPGSSHIANMNLIMSLAALKMRMSIEETINSVTINAAKALDLEKVSGSIEPGKNADLAIFNTTEYADLVYSVGKNLNVITIKNGKVIYNSAAN